MVETLESWVSKRTEQCYEGESMLEGSAVGDVPEVWNDEDVVMHVEVPSDQSEGAQTINSGLG